MKIQDNTINSAANYFRDELLNLYDTSELNLMLFIAFNHYFGIERVDLILNNTRLLSESDLLKIIYCVKGLKKNKPLAQILGEWEFYGMNLKVNEHTLIPRPETEELVQLIINENKEIKRFSILDIGTGSGCIALAIKQNLPHANIFAYDVSEEALEVASTNAKRNKLAITFNKVDILDWETQYSNDKFDIIVSNPPYITLKEKNLMAINVLNYEPHLALFVPNEDPLLFYRTIADFAIARLNKNGKLYFEINENYGNEVEQLLADKKFTNIEVIKDINGKDRMVKANLIN